MTPISLKKLLTEGPKYKIIKVYNNDNPNDTRGHWFCPHCGRNVPQPVRYNYCRACNLGYPPNPKNDYRHYLQSRGV